MISARATQDFVPVKEVRDGIIILKDGGMRAVLLASSINLSLKSADEQMAVLSQFQTFLNSLEFSTQILVQSRRYDIRPYLALLENRVKEQIEPLIKIQTKEYIGFIRSFTEAVAIMNKKFFIVVPYGASGLPSQTSGGSFFGKKSDTDKKKDALIEFEEQRTQLQQRTETIISGLGRVGVRVTQLDTEAVVELLYKTFNPGEISTAIKAETAANE